MIPFLILMLAAGGDATKGKELFLSCVGCHNVENDQRKMGPSLRSLFGKVTLHNGKHADDENVREIVLDGYNGMPPFRYSFRPAEINDLMAYLHTLTAKPAAPAVSRGEAVFHAYCLRCHATDLRGKFKSGPIPDEAIKAIDEGHSDAPAMNDWIDSASRAALLDFLRVY
ncbi:MAG: c-type cytochrome [Terriglobia bacterium]